MFYFLPDVDICLDQRTKWWSASKFMLASSCILSLLIRIFSHTCWVTDALSYPISPGGSELRQEPLLQILLHIKGDTQAELHAAPTGLRELRSFHRDVRWQQLPEYWHLPLRMFALLQGFWVPTYRCDADPAFHQLYRSIPLLSVGAIHSPLHCCFPEENRILTLSLVTANHLFAL